MANSLKLNPKGLGGNSHTMIMLTCRQPWALAEGCHVPSPTCFFTLMAATTTTSCYKTATGQNRQLTTMSPTVTNVHVLSKQYYQPASVLHHYSTTAAAAHLCGLSAGFTILHSTAILRRTKCSEFNGSHVCSCYCSPHAASSSSSSLNPYYAHKPLLMQLHNNAEQTLIAAIQSYRKH